MSDIHWYRNTDWDDRIAEAFQQRLKRARDQKFQYLRIQAAYLAESHPQAALALLDQYFALGQHPDAAQAYVQMATAKRVLGDVEGALAAYWAALECERNIPNYKTQAYVDLAVFVVIERIQSEYAKILTLLDDHAGRPVFPVEHYRAEGARALLLKHFGKFDEARAAAQRAMDAGGATRSDFRYHQDLGLVSEADAALGKQVADLLC